MVVITTVPTFEALLVRSAMVLLALGLVWAAVVLVAVLVEAVTRGRVRLALALGCPRWCHRWLLGVLGTVLVAMSTGQPATAQTPSGGALEGLPLPDRPAGSRHHSAVGVSAEMTVRPGQSLWAISRSRLPPDADPARTAALARSLYRTNRALVGDDPDLIHPGQRLIIPRTTHETYPEDS